MLSWFNILMSTNVNLIQSVQNASKEPTPIACICILWHIVPLVPPSHNSKPIKYRILHNQAQYIITKKKKILQYDLGRMYPICSPGLRIQPCTPYKKQFLLWVIWECSKRYLIRVPISWCTEFPKLTPWQPGSD